MATSEFPDLTTLTDAELNDLLVAIDKEKYARLIINAAPEATNNIIKQYHDAITRTLPEGEIPQWAQPTGAHDAYPKDYKVMHNSKTWVSLIPANVWEPGVSGWREETTGIAAWVQPTGAHDAYPIGAKVTHKSKTWISISADNVWEPGVFGWNEVVA